MAMIVSQSLMLHIFLPTKTKLSKTTNSCIICGMEKQQLLKLDKK